MYDKILFGKNQLEHIVAIEVKDDKAIVFQETEQGLTIKEFAHSYWILSTYQVDESWIRLIGHLPYQYGKQYKSEEEWLRDKKYCRNREKFFTIHDKIEATLVKDGYTLFKGSNPLQISILAFDLETTGIKHDDTSKILLISNTFRKNGQIERKLFAYNDYETEKEFIEAWCAWVREKDPTILLGYNIIGFDLPYLSYIAQQNNVLLRLGRDNSVLDFDDYPRKFRVDGNRELTYNRIHCYGRQIIDGMFLSVKYDIGRKYNSYALKSIIKEEGLEQKDRQFYDASQIRFKYHIAEEWKKIKQYCIHDSDDALKLYDLMCPAYFMLCNYIPKTYQNIIESASGSQLNAMMMRAYLQEAHSLPKAEYIEKYEGGISFGVPGIYRNVWKLDIKSEYPSVIREYEIYDKRKDPKAILLYITNNLTEMRFKIKEQAKTDKNAKALDASIKVVLNSLYGLLGANGLLFNSMACAELVTQKGREMLAKGIKWASGNDLEHYKEFYE